MSEFIITPAVDAVREFLEIAGDFTNPLELVREGVSNAIDASATDVQLTFNAVQIVGATKLEITVQDNGSGMDMGALQSFFDLGNSLKRGDPKTIGEKGHGTKVFFNCERLSVDTVREGRRLVAVMEAPYATLHGGGLPEVKVTEHTGVSAGSGTTIRIIGFNSNKGELFTHQRILDYIRWFTKFGSFEQQFDIQENADKRIVLKGLDRDEHEIVPFGHPFPPESETIAKLFDQYVVKAPDFYCKKIVKSGNLKKHPWIKYDAVFYIEGNKIKQSYNNMLRRSGYQAPAGNYQVSERYGVWLSKDFIPVERKNQWISQKGSEYLKFHAFFNCQNLSLTANRGSVANTPPDILADIEESIRSIYNDIVEGDDWREMEWLESEADAFQTREKESKDFEWRKTRAIRSNVAKLSDVALIEPTRESGVYALLIQLSTLNPELFPFEIVDYDTHSGIDVIGKIRSPHAVETSSLFYVELKLFLERNMNHSFANIRYVVCWDTIVKHGDHVTDLAGEERTMNIVAPQMEDGGYTGYFLKRNFKQDIEVFVLKDYLREKLGLEFRPRTLASTTVL